MAIAMTRHEAEITLDFELDPPAGDWVQSDGTTGESRMTYRSNGYSLDLDESPADGCTLVQFALSRDAGAPFTIHQYEVQTESSAVDLDRIWMPWQTNSWVEAVGLFRATRYSGAVAWRDHGMGYRTMADRGIPIILGLNRKGTTRLAVGFLDQRIETIVTHAAMTHQASGLQDCGTMRFRLQRPIDGYALNDVTEHRDGFFVASGASWFDTMQQYRAVHDAATGRPMRPSPDAAWEPVLAPWGAPKGKWGRCRDEALGPNELWEIAQVAAGLGIKGFINWGNWCRDYYPEFDIAQLTWGFPDFIGDFGPSQKFPDFKGFVRQLRELGFMSICWISPWLVGRRTRARERLKEAVVELDMDPAAPGYNTYTSYLCPRHPRTQEYVVDLVAGVMREYGLDGFTVDMVDSAPIDRCVAEHEHNYSSVGLAVADTFARIRGAVDAINPNAVIEIRPQYSNIGNLYNATAHRSVDSGEAGSYDMNRRQCLILRSYVPPGVAVHLDPQWWHKDEPNETVAKMLATMVVSGVPQIGADVLNMTDHHRRLVKAWLSFYQEHKEDFRYGQMRPVQNDALFSTIKVERGRRAFVHYASYPALRVPLSPAVEEIYLFNCTNEASLYTILLGVTGEFTATIHDYDLAPRSEARLQARDDALLVDLPVPEGGYVVVRRNGGMQSTPGCS